MSERGGIFVRRWSLTVVWLVYWFFLFTATHLPLDRFRLPAHGEDKIVHFLGYFALAILAGRAAIHRGVALTPKWFLLWTVIFLIYGGVDEWLQQWVNRTPSWRDWYADVMGTLIGMFVLYGSTSQGNGTDDRASDGSGEDRAF